MHKKNRTALSFGLMISSLIAFLYGYNFLDTWIHLGFDIRRLLGFGLCLAIIIFNTLAFITTDKPNEEFARVKWKSIVSFVLFLILYSYILIMFVGGEYDNKRIAMAVFLMATATAFLLLIGFTTRTQSETAIKNMKD